MNIDAAKIHFWRSNLAAWGAATVVTGAIGGLLVPALKLKELVYDITFIGVVLGKKGWAHQIQDNIILGALPTETQADAIKNSGVTHVLSVVEDFELRKGVTCPMTKELWAERGIEHHQIPLPDFFNIDPDKIEEAVQYIRQIMEDDPGAKFYIHCKAGLGRSASVVLAYILSTRGSSGDFKKEIKDLEKEMQAIRSQVSINSWLNYSLLRWCRKYLAND